MPVARENRVFLWVGALLAMSWLTLAFMPLESGSRVVETVTLGYFFGSLFANATLAAAWTAFGPAPLAWRLPLSLLWLWLSFVTLYASLEVRGGQSDFAIVVGKMQLGQWLLLQLPLCGLKWKFKLCLRYGETSRANFDPQQWQFGIRQLLIVTTIAGVIFSLGRSLLASFPDPQDYVTGDGAFFALAFVTIVLTLPLVFAALTQGGAVVGSFLALVLIGLGTAMEGIVLHRLYENPSPDIYDFTAINFFTSAFILAVLVTVRLSGYSFSRQGERDG